MVAPKYSKGEATSRTVKIVLIGDGAVGKTSLLNRYANDSFNPDHEPTVFENTWLDRVIDGRRVELALWDNAGQEEFDKLRLLSYQETDVFLVVYSLNSKDAYRNINDKWIEEIKEHSIGVPLILVATKCDLRTSTSTLILKSQEDGESLAQTIGAVAYMECSAKTNTNCTEVFEQAVREALASQESRKQLRKAHQKKSKRKSCIIC